MNEQIKEKQKNPLELAVEAFQLGSNEIISNREEIARYHEAVSESISTIESKSSEFAEAASAQLQRIEDIKSELSEIITSFGKLPEALSGQRAAFVKDWSDAITEAAQATGAAKMEITEKDRQALSDTAAAVEKFLSYSSVAAGLLFLQLLSVILMGTLATRFYRTSVRTKTEVRAELLSEIEKKNQVIIGKDLLSALRNERLIIRNWSQTNPKDAKSYITFRTGTITANPKNKFFKELTNEDVE